MVHVEIIDLVFVLSASIKLVRSLLCRVAFERLKVHVVGLLNILVLLLINVHISQEVIDLPFYRINLGFKHIVTVQVAPRPFRRDVRLWFGLFSLTAKATKRGK